MKAFLRDCHARQADAFNDFMETQKASKLDTFSYLDLTGFPAELDIEQRFLPEESLAKYAGSLPS